MSNEKKYPCIVNKSEREPDEYIGILFNGDQGIYLKETVKALKKSVASHELIRAVKATDGDLQLSKILIEAGLYDVLVKVFNDVDFRTVIYDYVEELYQEFIYVVPPYVYVNIMASISKILEEFQKQLGLLKLVNSQLLGNSYKDIKNSDEILSILDRIIIVEQPGEELRELLNQKNEIAKMVLKNYFEACKK